MSEQTDDYQPTFVKMPDFNQMMAQRLNPVPPPPNASGFDPHKVMVNKKEMESSSSPEDVNIHKWPEDDIKTLEDFCKQHGIIGFNCGRMSPIAALALLKAKLGIIDTIPVEQRYSSEINKKSLLKG